MSSFYSDDEEEEPHHGQGGTGQGSAAANGAGGARTSLQDELQKLLDAPEPGRPDPQEVAGTAEDQHVQLYKAVVSQVSVTARASDFLKLAAKLLAELPTLIGAAVASELSKYGLQGGDTKREREQDGTVYKNVIKELLFARYGTLNAEDPLHPEWLTALILRILGSTDGGPEVNNDDVATKTSALRKHFPSWRWQVHEAARIAIQEAWAFNDGEALGKRGPWWKDGRFDKEIAGWYVTDNRYRCRSISDGITDVGMDPYGRRPYRVGLLTFVGSDADPRAPDCLKDVTSAQIAIYESLLLIALKNRYGKMDLPTHGAYEKLGPPQAKLLEEVSSRVSVFRSQADNRGPNDHAYWNNISIAQMLTSRKRRRHSSGADYDNET